MLPRKCGEEEREERTIRFVISTPIFFHVIIQLTQPLLHALGSQLVVDLTCSKLGMRMGLRRLGGELESEGSERESEEKGGGRVCEE